MANPLQLALDRSLRSIDPQNGHMTVEMSRISKANVCPYKGSEIPHWQELGLDPQRTYRLLRSPDELALAADSFSNLPLLIRHVPIHAEKPSRDLWVGTTGTVSYEHPYLVSRPLKVWTQQAIDLIASETQRELSSGYGYEADMSPGQYEGESFDGIMRKIRGNHLAIVTEGRVGPDVHVADELPTELKSMKHAALIEKLKAAGMLVAGADLMALDNIFEVGSTSPHLSADEEAEMEAEDKAHDYYQNSAEDWGKMCGEDRAKARDEFKKDEEKKAADKKARDKKAADKRAADKKARDADPDHRKDFNSEAEGGADSAITADQMNAAIKAATSETRAQAVAEARAEARAAAIAREAVKPIVGIIALDARDMDTAEQIYGFALKHAGVALDGVPPAAYGAMVALVKTRKAAPSPAIALDSAALQHNVTSIFRQPTAH